MSDRKRVSLPVLFDKIVKGTPLTMITCYDYPMATLVEQAGIDIVLVGDSLGMTMLGYDSTLPVTMADMIRHAQAVRRGTPSGWLIGDMPYMSYQASDESAVLNAGRFMAEAACDGIKLEGGQEMCGRVRAIVAAGIPVMGHLGLTPQSVLAFGGFKVQAKTRDAVEAITLDARALQDEGAYAIVIEGVPSLVGTHVTQALAIPTIGIGAGPDTDGQVLVWHDLLGLSGRTPAKFVRRYADLGAATVEALRHYAEDVRAGTFPDESEAYANPDGLFD